MINDALTRYRDFLRLQDVAKMYAIALVTRLPLGTLTLSLLLYVRAYTKRAELGLDDLEVFDLRSMAGHHVVSAAVGAVALAIAVLAPATFSPFSPMSLSLMGPGHFLWGLTHGRQRAALEKRLAQLT